MGSFGRLIPFLIVLVSVFAVYQFFMGVLFAARASWGFAAIYFLMAIAGSALARTLWINKARLSGKTPPS